MIDSETSQMDVDFTNTEIAFSSKSDKELKNQARLFRFMNNPSLVKMGSPFALLGARLNFPLTNSIIKKTVFTHFCGGETLLECQPKIDHLRKFKTFTILDFGAEGKSTEAELDWTLQEFLRAVEFAGSNASVPVVSVKLTALADNDLMEKWQTGDSFSEQESLLWEKVMDRVNTLCETAFKNGVKVFIDAEESWIQGTIAYLAEEMMKKYNKEQAVVYTTYQLYRHDHLAQLELDYEKSLREKYVFATKLVRGAYMGKERARAKEMDYPSPIQPDKPATDRDYNAAVKFCVDHYKTLGMCNATHNLESSMLQAELITEKNLPKSHPHLSFSQLYGMSDNITFNLANAGYNVAKYLPYGPVKEVVPYLIRRAKENSSVTGDMSRELKLIVEELERRGL